MFGVSKDELKRLKTLYNKGVRICLDYMYGEPYMYPGLKGTVEHVDDIGQIHVKWDNGSTLALNTECDEFHLC